MPEKESYFTPKDQRKIPRLDERLRNSDSTCFIDIKAIAHDWEPGEELILSTQKADIVTLELTRNVVTQGLQSEDSPILDRNIFWRRIIENLRQDQEQRLVRGVEVNQTARNALKRLTLYTGSGTLSQSLVTVAVENPDSPEVTELLGEEDAEFLRTHNWKITDDSSIALQIFQRMNETMDKIEKGEIKKEYHMPLSFPRNLTLVSDRLREADSFNERYPVTFMKPPHPSLLASRNQIQDVLSKDSPIPLTEKERQSISSSAMIKFLLSHSELKDAEEILYNVYQHTSNKIPQQRNIQAIHLGGAAHAEAILHVLGTELKRTNIKVSVSHDPRFPHPISRGDLLEFFGNTIPFSDRLSGISVKGFEAYADPSHISEVVKKSITHNQEEFTKRILIYRIIANVFNDTSNKGRDFDIVFAKEVYTKQGDLFDLPISTLTKMLEDNENKGNITST